MALPSLTHPSMSRLTSLCISLSSMVGSSSMAAQYDWIKRVPPFVHLMQGFCISYYVKRIQQVKARKVLIIVVVVVFHIFKGHVKQPTFWAKKCVQSSILCKKICVKARKKEQKMC